MNSSNNEIKLQQKDKQIFFSSKTIYKNKKDFKSKNPINPIDYNLTNDYNIIDSNFLSKIKLPKNLIKQNTNIQLILNDYKESFKNDLKDLNEDMPFKKELKRMSKKISSKTLHKDLHLSKNINTSTHFYNKKSPEELISYIEKDREVNIVDKSSFLGKNDSNDRYFQVIKSNRKYENNLSNEKADNDILKVEYNRFPKRIIKSNEDDISQSLNHDRMSDIYNLKEDDDLLNSELRNLPSRQINFENPVSDGSPFNDSLEDLKFNGKKRELIKLINVYDSLSFSEEIYELNYSSLLIDPSGKFKRFWDILMIIIILYSIIVTPYIICFADNKKLFEIILEFIVDSIFIFDFVFNFFTPFYDKEENLITRIVDIRKNYIENSFYFDLLTCIPISIIDYTLIYNHIPSSGKFFVYLQWITIFRIFRLNITNSNIYLSKLNNFKDTKINRMLRFLFYFSVVIHVTSCFWIFIGKISFYEVNWIQEFCPDKFNKFDIYIASLYFNLVTIYTIGYGDITAVNKMERIYLCFFMFIGIILYSLAVSNFSTFITINDKRTLDYEKQLDILSMIEAEYEIPKSLNNKIKKYLKACYDNSYDERYNLLESLPNKIKNDLTILMYKNHIRELYFFKDQSHDFILYVLPLLKTHNTKKDDTLFSIGEYIEDMYLVVRGTLVLTLSDQLDNIEIFEIRANQHFGEIFLETHEQSTYELKCKSKRTLMLVLKKNDYLNVKNVFRENIIEILKKSYNTLERIDKKKKVILELLKVDDNPKSIRKIIKIINREIRMNAIDNYYDNKDKSDDEVDFLVKNQEKFTNLLKMKIENQKNKSKKQTENIIKNLTNFKPNNITKENQPSPFRKTNYNNVSDYQLLKSSRTNNSNLERKNSGSSISEEIKQKETNFKSSDYEQINLLDVIKESPHHYNLLQNYNTKRTFGCANTNGINLIPNNHNFTLNPLKKLDKSQVSKDRKMENILGDQLISNFNRKQDIYNKDNSLLLNKNPNKRKNTGRRTKTSPSKRRKAIYNENSSLITEIFKNIDLDQKHLNLLFEQKDIQIKARSLLKRKTKNENKMNTKKENKQKNKTNSYFFNPLKEYMLNKTDLHESDFRKFIIINNNFNCKSLDQNINDFYSLKHTNIPIPSNNHRSLNDTNINKINIDKEDSVFKITNSISFDIFQSSSERNLNIKERSLKIERTVEVNINITPFIKNQIKRRSFRINKHRLIRPSNSMKYNSDKYLVTNKFNNYLLSNDYSQKILNNDNIGVYYNDLYSENSLNIKKVRSNNNYRNELTNSILDDFIRIKTIDKKLVKEDGIKIMDMDKEMNIEVVELNNKIYDQILIKKMKKLNKKLDIILEKIEVNYFVNKFKNGKKQDITISEDNI